MIIKGTYGASKKKCTIYVYKGWYCVRGSVNINHTEEPLNDGVDVEEVYDDNTMSAKKPILTYNQLVREVNS